MSSSNTDFKLRKSSYHERRKQLIKSNESPKLSEASKNLGGPLSNILFDQCYESVKCEFGLDPTLQGPKGDLWISPSDLLIGKVALKPPFTSKCLQALTHRGVLEIGAIVECRFRNEMELEKKKALERNRRILIDSLEDKMKAEIKDVELREKLHCSEEVNKLTKEFDLILIAELEKLEKTLKEEYDLALEDQKHTINIQWQEIVNQEVQKTVHSLTTEFFQKLDEQEKILTMKFKYEMKKLQIHHKEDLKMNENITKKILRQVKHYLECKNLANMMYVLCLERRRCCDEKTHIENYYKNEILKLEKSLSDKNEEKEKLTKEKEKIIKELELRETCLLKILTEFQKFINFALRASPTQAEFLLSVEKMMVFEMSDAIKKADIPRVQSDEGLLPWLHGHDSVPSTQSSGLEIKDYHDCMNEVTPPRRQSEIGIISSDQDLPAVFYKGKMYVREDFRDMMSAGIKITPSNELWNEDVEILMQTMRASVTKIEIDGQDSGYNLGVKWSDHTASAKKVSIGVVNSGGLLNRHQQLHRRSSIKPTCLPPPSFTEMIPPVQQTQSKLLAARDSVELVRSKIQSMTNVSIKKDNLVNELAEDMTIVDSEQHSAFYHEENNISLENEKEKVIHDIIHEDREVLEQQKAKGYDDNMKDQIIEDILPFVQKLSLVSDKKDDTYYFDTCEKRRSREQSSSVRDIYESKPQKKISSKDAVNMKGNASNNLVVETKDSIILRKASLTKKSEDFKLSPQDSIETHKDNIYKSQHPEISLTPSKLLSAKNSLDILRESLLKVKEPFPECPKRKSITTINGSSLSRFSLSVCDKVCLAKKKGCLPNISASGSNISQSILPIDSKNLSTVVFNKEAEIYDVQDDTPISLDFKEEIVSKRELTRPPDVRLKSNELKVVGELNSKEGERNIDEFTTERIHSFIDLIKDHPNLIRLFTSH